MIRSVLPVASLTRSTRSVGAGILGDRDLDCGDSGCLQNGECSRRGRVTVRLLRPAQ